MILKVIYGLLLLDILVVLHELGHFFAARISGVKVETFSVGMGPVIVHKTIKNIDWRVSLFPIGGYCGMKGESDFQKAVEEKKSKIEADSDSFYGCNPWKSFFIAISGPLTNFFFAVFAYTIIAIVGYSYISAGTTITLADEIYPELHSAARDGGLLSGDKITAINGKKMEDFSDIAEFIALRGDEEVEIEVLRNAGEKEELLTFSVHTDFSKEDGRGKIGVVSDRNSMEYRRSKTYSFFPAIKEGFKETFKFIYYTFKSFKILTKGVKLQNTVSGPARITTMLGDTAKEGFSVNFQTGVVAILQLLAMISVSLFIMNLLPIPVLDGCIVLFSLIEGIFKIRISPKVRFYSQYAGLAILCILFAISLFSDFSYFIGLKK